MATRRKFEAVCRKYDVTLSNETKEGLKPLRMDEVVMQISDETKGQLADRYSQDFKGIETDAAFLSRAIEAAVRPNV